MSSNNFTRRDFFKVSALAAGAAALGACAPNAVPDATGEPVSTSNDSAKTDIHFLNELVGSKEDGRTYLLAAFNAANDKINVTHEGYGGADTVDQKFLTSLAGGIVPDLFHNEANYIPAYAEMDALTDLGPYLDASKRIKKSDIDPHPLELCTYNGKIYGIPIWQETTMLYYNKDVMAASGLDPEKPPRDWDSLLAAALKTVKRDAAGSLLVAGLVQDDWTIIRTFQAALYSWGGQLLSDDGTEAAFNSKEGKEALQTLVDMILVDKVGDVAWGGELEGTPEEPFVVGKQAFKFDVAAAAKRFAANAPDFVNWGVTSLPAGPTGFKEVSRPPALMIPKSAKNPDQAWRVIEYWLDTKVELRWALDILRAPTLLSSQADPALQNNKVISVLAETLKNTTDTPKTRHWAELIDTLGAESFNALTGSKTVAQALDDAAATLNPVLKT